MVSARVSTRTEPETRRSSSTFRNSIASIPFTVQAHAGLGFESKDSKKITVLENSELSPRFGVTRLYGMLALIIAWH